VQDSDYASERRITVERVIAGLCVLAWMSVAFRMGGIPLAVRAGILFMVPLSFIWMPGLMSRIAGVASKKSLEPDYPVGSFVLRLVGWFVILGVPAAWFIFSRI
jgi:hypothetical protein